MKVIEGYPNYYVASNGDVYSSLHSKNGLRKLKPGKAKKGYLTVHLYKNKKGHSHTVHRIVAKAFILNPMSLPQVNHKDTNKANNCSTNLEWCDNRYNHLHAFKYGQVPVKGEQVGCSKLTETQVIEIRQRYIKGKVGCYNLARQFNVAPTTISDIVNKRTWRHI